MDRTAPKASSRPRHLAGAKLALALSLLVGGAAGAFAGGARVEAASPAQATALNGESSMLVAARRLTETEYRHSIADIFGSDVVVNGRFEPEVRKDGLIAVGSGAMSITSSGIEQYFAIARSISDQVLNETRRGKTLDCKPAKADAPDDACTQATLRKYGGMLFRRPLTENDIAPRVKLAAQGAAQSKDYYAGLKLALVSLLTAPDYLFRFERAEVDPARSTQLRLDAYTKAARLSYLIWNTTPDAELLRAAAAGELHTDQGLKAQIARLSASPRVEDGVRAFFTDMLQFETFDSLTKDAKTYPKFSLAVADGAREQTLKTVVDLLVTRNGDYRDLFTSRETFINRPLAAVYNVPYTFTADWARYTFPEDSGQSGLLTQTTFLSLFSHPGRSSPTKRGVKLHEIFMCEPTPLPPPDVDFSKVRNSNAGTVRDRLLAHMNNEGCAGCHRVSDPIGLALEEFDGLGQRRFVENGQKIDVSSQVDGVKFSGAQGLGKVLRDNEKIPACLVKDVYSYGVGRGWDDDDEDYLAREVKQFAAGGYRAPALMGRIASTPEFYRVVVPTRPAPTDSKKVAGGAGTATPGL